MSDQANCNPLLTHLLRLHTSCRYLARQQSRIVYVESIARVFSLSLSGKILYILRLADAVFVQWPELQQRYSRCEYKGRLF